MGVRVSADAAVTATIVEQGASERIFTSPGGDYTRRLLADTPRAPAR